MKKTFFVLASALLLFLLVPIATNGRVQKSTHRLTKDAFKPPASSIKKYRSIYKSKGGGPSPDQTSTYMIGSTAVKVVFVQSDASIDVKTQPDWTQLQITRTMSEIREGLNWWVNKNTSARLTFSYAPYLMGTTGYEPINRTAADENLWISEIMNAQNQNGFDHISKVRNYDNELRRNAGTDWAVTIFVVNSVNDADNSFPDGLFAYAYLGGPFVVMTYGNDGYGIGNMNFVLSHEIGHTFNALDEYAESGSSGSDRSGYLYGINGNFGGSVPCIMMGDVTTALCDFTSRQVGWRDSDGDGKLDPVDTFPAISLSTTSPIKGSVTVSGTATDVPFPSANPDIPDTDINKITGVTWRLDGGSFINAIARDGAFNSQSENFYYTVSGLSSVFHRLETLVRNSIGNQSRKETNLGSPPLLVASRVLIRQMPPGTRDYIIGLRGAAISSAYVRVISPYVPHKIMGYTAVRTDGSFGKIYIGSNRFSRVYINAINSNGDRSSSIVKFNDIMRPRMAAGPVVRPAAVKAGGTIKVRFKVTDNSLRTRMFIKLLYKGRKLIAFIRPGNRLCGVWQYVRVNTGRRWPKGSYAVRVFAKDAAGNPSSPVASSFGLR